MQEWLKIIQDRDDRIAELERQYQEWSNQDAAKIKELEQKLADRTEELRLVKAEHLNGVDPDDFFLEIDEPEHDGY